MALRLLANTGATQQRIEDDRLFARRVFSYMTGENTQFSGSPESDVSELGFRRLVEFRHRIRQFLPFREGAARSKGIEPQLHQVLPAIKGLLKEIRSTITAVSQQLCLRHHSTVELIDRLEKRGSLRRRHSEQDRRRVLIELTSQGEALLHRLSVLHREELCNSGPALSESLHAVMHHTTHRRNR